ncbi:hypothetical protein EV715DRAFT_254172, partial [Schizophyllum commune]
MCCPLPSPSNSYVAYPFVFRVIVLSYVYFPPSVYFLVHLPLFNIYSLYTYSSKPYATPCSSAATVRRLCGQRARSPSIAPASSYCLLVTVVAFCSIYSISSLHAYTVCLNR